MDRPHILKPIEFYMKACFATTVIFPGGEDQVNVLTVVRRPFSSIWSIEMTVTQRAKEAGIQSPDWI